MIQWRDYPTSQFRRHLSDTLPLRLARPYASIPNDRLPNGAERPDYVRMEAAFALGGQVHFLCRVVRREGETVLQVQAQALDLARGRRVRLDPPPALLSQVYAELATAYLAAQGRRYGRREGRN